MLFFSNVYFHLGSPTWQLYSAQRYSEAVSDCKTQTLSQTQTIADPSTAAIERNQVVRTHLNSKFKNPNQVNVWTWIMHDGMRRDLFDTVQRAMVNVQTGTYLNWLKRYWYSKYSINRIAKTPFASWRQVESHNLPDELSIKNPKVVAKLRVNWKGGIL